MPFIAIADIGSTTTKLLLLKDSEILCREESATTVEYPQADVNIGFHRTMNLIQQKIGKKIGYDKFLFSSSAGGGLQVIAIGITNTYTAKSAYKLAMGAGAIVVETLAFDDGRSPYERLNSLNKHRPDLILFAGGFEGGAMNQIVEMAEVIIQSDIHPKFEVAKLPLIYAGNSHALPFIEKSLNKKFLLKVVPNINPQPNIENFAPARNAIIETFINHVISAAPGYTELMQEADLSPLPTPIAVERFLSIYSKMKNENIFAFDVGGATTDCYSVTPNSVERTVAANLGMTYSLPYVIRTCGIKKIMRYLKKKYNKDDILNFIGNRYTRPTTISVTKKELEIEEAVARNVISEAYHQHRQLVKSIHYDLIICSGGFFAHHPNKLNIKQIVVDALGLSNNCVIAIDKLFILPHLGSLTQIDKSLAVKLFLENVYFL